MIPESFDTLTRAVPAVTRRGTVRLIVAAPLTGMLSSLLSTEHAGAKKPAHNRQKKRKPTCKEKSCPECVCPSPPPPPPPAPFCQGKNTCTQGDQPCQQEGTAACFCYVRADNAEPFCGRLVAGQPPVGSCTQCAAGQECMVLGGECPTGYACVTACPAPR